MRLGVFRCLLWGLAPWLPAVSVGAPSAVGLEAHGTGVFLNPDGDVLTARHVVEGCASVFVVKDSQVVRAAVAAQSTRHDLAVLRTPLKPYLSAVLAASVQPGAGGEPVFAESYNALQNADGHNTTMFNAITVPSQDGLSMLSPVQQGASGSPVLGTGGLVVGVVVARAVRGVSVAAPLARAQARNPYGAAIRVKAIPVGEVKAFLREQDVPFTESEVPQLGPTQARAPRAATLSVGVICG